jgi:hypothetical protein
MRRIFVAVKARTSDGAIRSVWDWFVLECGHLASRHTSVAPIPKKMYCQKCSRAASVPNPPIRCCMATFQTVEDWQAHAGPGCRPKHARVSA